MIFTRRDFLALSLSASAVWIPNVLRGWQVQAELPAGLGIGINIDNTASKDAAIALAVATLQPRWFFHWHWLPASGFGFLPLLQPCPSSGGVPPYPANLAALREFRQAMYQAGNNIDAVPWLIGNEPEFSGWTPVQTAEAMAAQVRVLQDFGLRPMVIAPSSNITTAEHLAYLDAWRNAAAQHGLSYTLAVHCYEHRIDMLEFAWHRFSATLNAGERVIITECGAGANRSIDDWILVMPWFFRLLTDPHVQALAPFSAYPYPGYPGMMTLSGDLTPLGQHWKALQARLA